MTGFYAFLSNAEAGVTTVVGPSDSRQVVEGIAARARRHEDIDAGVIGRLDGGVRDD